MSRIGWTTTSILRPGWIKAIGRTLAIPMLFLIGASKSHAQSAATTIVTCASAPGGRETCAADTSAGVALTKSVGPSTCLLGKTWGFVDKSIWVSDGCSAEFTIGAQEPKHFGTYTPDVGFRIADTDHGTLTFKLFSYVRYLNQKQLDPTFTDSFGNTSPVQQRQDLQVNKVLLYFLGWIASPKLRYLMYVWTTNVSQGQSAQVIVAGNLNYTFNDHISAGVGIASLPGVRSTEGNFPYWLGVDNRTIADEFFRPSYTTGVFVNGKIVRTLEYHAMLGVNLSQLGIDAGQLDNGLNTWTTSLVWMPSTGEFGPASRFGDFANHEKIATRLAGHFTRSKENSQSQPTNTDSFDNVQIRLSDGNPIFKPGLFGPGVLITDAVYNMASYDGGIKYRGYAVEGEFYQRWLNDFRGPGTAGLAEIQDHGYQIQASAMVLPKILEAYVSNSRIFGHYGNPWDARVGLNWYPWKLEGIRLNAEYIQLHRSPVGGLSLPYPVGGNGPTFNLNFQVGF